MKELSVSELNKFMGRLLKSDVFDSFCLREGTLRTFMEINYDGELLTDFFDTEERENLPKDRYVSWKEVRGSFLEAIKGKRTPLMIKLSFVASEELKNDFLQKAKVQTYESESLSCNLNFIFKNNSASLITGFYRSNFSLDKEPEKAWDSFFLDFLRENEINFEEIV